MQFNININININTNKGTGTLVLARRRPVPPSSRSKSPFGEEHSLHSDPVGNAEPSLNSLGFIFHWSKDNWNDFARQQKIVNKQRSLLKFYSTLPRFQNGSEIPVFIRRWGGPPVGVFTARTEHCPVNSYHFWQKTYNTLEPLFAGSYSGEVSFFQNGTKEATRQLHRVWTCEFGKLL